MKQKPSHVFHQNLIFWKAVWSIVFCLIFSLFLFPKQADALTTFSTDYQVIYTVSENGTTHATLNATLTNTSSQYYASNYSMQLGFDQISNVTASDPNGSIIPSVQKTPDGYNIGVQFNKKSVGIGSKLPFTISFDTKSVAKRYGKIWEINIPGIANPADFQNFIVTIVVPQSFGRPVYTKPTQPTNSLTFTKEQLGRSGISIAFGDKQYYAFHMTYHLQNDHIYPAQTEIALPPTTNYQTVYISSINPRPENVTTDSDGNWLAQYQLLPTQKLDILVDGKAQIGLTPQTQPISQTEIAQDIAPTTYWQSNNDVIHELADSLSTPEGIYNYIVRTLKYDFSRVTNNSSRLGALAVLKKPTSAVCLEFTDLFIALARARGIPAREVDGFAYTENSKQRPVSLVKDVLHAWPEYYDSSKNAWIMVDPTWGNTTGGIDYLTQLDFDHFAFVIKGKNSTYPVPAGGYKVSGNPNQKDVEVNFTQTIPDEANSTTLESSFSNPTIAGLPISGKILVHNINQNSLAPQTLSITSQMLRPQAQSFKVASIPPYGYATVPVNFSGTSFLTKKSARFTIQLSDNTTDQSIKVLPIYLTPVGIGGTIIVIFAIIIFIIAKQSGRLQIS